MSKKKKTYVRKATYPIQSVLPFICWDEEYKKKPPYTKPVKDYGGDLVKMGSLRYKTFATSGCKCVFCGLEGEYFAKEKFATSKVERYHFNLYGHDENGREVMLTKDHIIPKSKGGPDTVENMQTACMKCNSKRGNDYVEGYKGELVKG